MNTNFIDNLPDFYTMRNFSALFSDNLIKTHDDPILFNNHHYATRQDMLYSI